MFSKIFLVALLIILFIFVMTCKQMDAVAFPIHEVVQEQWAEDQIVDVHAHIGSFSGFDLSMETLLSNLQRFNIRLALISNIDGAHLPGTTRDLDEKSANQATLKTVRKYPDLLRGIAWARPPDAEGSPANLEPFLRDHGFLGVKLHPEMNQFAADDPMVDGYMALCAEYDVPAVFHSGAKGSKSAPEKIYTVARRHPDVPVILYHMGFFGAHDNAVAVVKESLTKQDADLYLDTAQAAPQAVLAAIRELGAERVLFGTDATYYGKSHYEKYIELVDLLRENLSPEDFEKVMSKNAIRLFRLEEMK